MPLSRSKSCWLATLLPTQLGRLTLDTSRCSLMDLGLCVKLPTCTLLAPDLDYDFMLYLYIICLISPAQYLNWWGPFKDEYIFQNYHLVFLVFQILGLVGNCFLKFLWNFIPFWFWEATGNLNCSRDKASLVQNQRCVVVVVFTLTTDNGPITWVRP